MAKMKKVLATILALVMLMQSMPLAALADAVYSNESSGSTYYVVSFTDINGGVLVTQYVRAGASPVVPDVPDVAGKEFDGWTVGGNKVDPAGYTINANTTFQAAYRDVNTYTVTIRYLYKDEAGTPAFPAWVKEYEAGVDVNETVESPSNVLATPDKPTVEINIPAIAENAEYTVRYEMTTVNYTVKHVGQNANDNGYDVQIAADEVLEGYPNQQTEAVAKTDVPGFTAKDFQQTTIEVNGDTVVTIEYDRNVHNLNVVSNGGTYTAGGTSGQVVEGGARRYGAALNLPDTMEKVGSEFEGWLGSDGNTYTSSSTMPDYDLTVTAQWSDVEYADYMVIHWQQNAADLTKYDFKQADEIKASSRRAKVGDPAVYTALNEAGFAEKAGTVVPTVAADGSTVVNVYYDRISYTIHFYTQSNNQWRENTSLAITAPYGTDISDKWPATVNGNKYQWYTASGLSTSIGTQGTMPLNGICNFDNDNKVYGEQKSNLATIYYKVQPIDGNESQTSSYETHSTGTMPRNWSINDADIIDLEGFTYKIDDVNARTLYYTRNSYSITFANTKEMPEVSGIHYQKNISSYQNAAGTVTPPSNLVGGYTFGGWYTSPDCTDGTEVNWNQTMPAHNLVFYAKWIAPIYTVNFYKNDGVTTEAIYTEQVEREDTIQNVPANPTREAEGNITYTFNSWYSDAACTVPFDATTPITGNKNVYAGWTAHGKVSYDLVLQEEGGKVIEVRPQDPVDIGTIIDMDVTDIPALDGYITLTQMVHVTITEEGQDIEILYRVNNSWPLTVKYLDEETGLPVADEHTEQVIYQQKVVVAEQVDGYNVVAPSYQIANEENNEIIFYYKRIVEKPYYVEFYTQNNDGSFALAESETREGKLGSTVDVTDADKGSYVSDTLYFDASYGENVLSGTVGTAENGGVLTLKVYFVQKEAAYVVHHYLKGTTTQVAADDTGKMAVGKTLTALPSGNIDPAYTGVALDSYSPAQTITINGDASKNVIIVYYTKDLTIKADSDEKTYDGQPLTDAGFSVSGVVGNDTAENFTAQMTADSTITDVGSKANTVDQATVEFKGGSIPSYYNVSYTDGTLKVNPKPVTVTADDKTKVYGTADPELTAQVEGTLNGDEIEYGLSRVSGENVGTYTITPAGEEQQGNYIVEYLPGTLTITKVETEIVITADSDEKTYDGTPLTNAGYTYTQGILVEGDKLEAVVEGSQTDAGESANVVKSYKVVRGEADVTANYNFGESVDGKLKVNPKPVTVTADDKTKVYGTADPELTAQVEGTLNGDEIEYGLSRVSGENVGTYTITPAGEEQQGNYIVEYLPGTLTITKVETEIVITAASDEKVYDGDPLTNANFTHTGTLVDGDVLTAVVEGSQTDAGESANVVTSYKVMRGAADVTANYTIGESIDGKLKVNPKPVTVTADDKTKVYGTADPELTAQVEGTIGTDTVEYTIDREDGENVGTYEIMPAGEEQQGNYIVEYLPGTLTITKVETEIVITADSDEKTYDGTPLTNAGYTYTQGILVEGDKLEAVVEGSQTDAGESANVVKSYKVVRGEADVTANYNFGESVDGKLKVNPKPVTVTADDKTKVYGTADPELTAQVEGTLNGDEIEYDLSRVLGENVGNYTITPAGEEQQGNYIVEYLPGTLTITKVETEIVITADSDEKTYDGTPLTNAGYTYTQGILVEGDKLEAVVEGSQTDAGESANVVKSYKVVRGEADVTANYNFGESVDGKLKVNPKPVTVTADDKTKVYGTADPELTAQVEGTLNGDEIEYGLSRVSGENVGNYTITPAGEEQQGNYIVEYLPGTLTITKVETEIVITADSDEKTYDGTPLTNAGYTYTQGILVEGDKLEAVVEGSQTDAGESANVVKSYKVVRGEADVTANYNFGESVDGKLKVNPKPVTVTADDKTKVYGTADPELTAQVEGTLNGDEIEYGLSRVSGENVGTYTITPAGEEQQGNYIVEYLPGTLTITKVETEIVITADSDEKTYDGTPLTNAGYTYTQGILVEGDKLEAVVEGSQTDAGESANVVKSYKVVRGEADVTANYNFGESVDGKLKVNPKPVTVTADDKTKVYGTADPELTAQVEGTLNGDEIEYGLSRVSGENVGTYTITPAGEEQQGNYIVEYLPGTLTITKVETEIVITADSDEKTYDGTPLTNAGYTYTQGILVEGDKLEAVVEGSQTDAGESANVVKSYKVVRGEADVTANYNFGESVDGKLKVNPKPVTVTADDKTKVYGTADPELTAQVEGTLNGDEIEYGLSRVSGENVGTYTITPAGEEQQGNYIVEYLPGTLTITKVETEIVITAASDEKVYDGDPLTNANFTHTGTLVDGDVLTAVVEGSQTDAGESANVVTSYKVMRGAADVTANYTIGESIDGKLTVTKRTVTLTSETASKEYDGTALTRPNVTVGGDGFVAGEATAEATGTIIDVGSVTNTIKVTKTAAFKEGNYDITKNEGTLTITKNGELTVNGIDYEGIYDAQPHGEAATASVTEGTTISYRVDGGEWTTTFPTITNVGENTVEVKAENHNYETATDTYTLKVNPKPVTVTADDKSKVYGKADPELTAQVEGTLNGDEVAYTISREPGENVGTYEIMPAGDEQQGNYIVTYLPGTLTIRKNSGMTVVGVDYEGIYDAQPHGEAATCNVIVGTTISYRVDGGEWTTTVPTITNVGEHTVEVKAENHNYATATDTYTLKVNPKPVTVTADDKSKVYGKADPELTAQVEGTLNGDEVAYTISREPGENVGTYEIMPAGDEQQGNYIVTYLPGTLTIRKNGGMTVEGVDYLGVYDAQPHGEPATSNVTVGTTLTYSVDGGEFTTTVPTITNVGKHTVTVKAENHNYTTAYDTYTLEVTPKAVTVKADDQTKVYGDADPELTATVTGVIDGFEVVYDVTREPGEDVGEYTITPAGETAQGNYEITYLPGTLTITKNATMTVEGVDYSGIYDNAVHGEAATCNVNDGNTVISYSVDGGSTWTTEFPTIKDIGTINVTVKAENKNYETATDTYILEVTPKAVTVKADDQSKVYGDADPELTATVTGVIDGFEVVYDVTREPGEDVGEYTITPAGEAAQGNYEITYLPGTLTITKNATMTVEGVDYSGIYDNAVHGEAATCNVNDGNTVISYSVDGGSTWSTEFPTIKDIGTINVVVKAENKNYETATDTYILEVTPKAVTVKADDQSKVYGDADPELTATVTGVIDGFEVVYDVTREPGEDVGEYTITPAGEAAQGNYEITYLPGTLTIIKNATMTVEGVDYSGIYDNAVHGEAATSNVNDGNTVISYSVDGGSTWSTDFPTIKDIGTINVVVKAENKNYETATDTYILEVTPKAVTVQADDQSKVYGDADPELTATVTGVIDGFEVVYDVTREPGEDVGEYTITPAGETAQGNYEITYLPGTLTITKNATMTVEGVDYSGIYDNAVHGEAATSNVNDGNTVISYSVDGGSTWSTEFPTIKDIGTINVVVKAENKNYETATDTYILEVTPKAVTVKADDQSKVYGDADPELTATVTGVIDGFEVVYDVTREPGEDVGEYTITPAGEAAQGNYEITYLPGTLTITKNATMTVEGVDYSGIYDNAVHGEAATSNVNDGNTVISYSVDGGSTWTTDFPTIKDVDVINVVVKAENKNYETATDTYILEVTPKAVTVQADDQSKVYGDEDPEFTTQVTGIIDEFVPAYEVTREPGEDVGTYAITPAGEAIQGNYEITYLPGTLTIIKNATMTVEGIDYTGIYDALPHGDAAICNVDDGNTVISYSIDGGATWTTEVPTITDVGLTNVMVKAENKNYETAEDTYTLEVTHRPVTVKADDLSKEYLAEDPELTATVTGTLNDDKLVYTLVRDPGEDPGVYPITASGEEIQGNYIVTYLPGTLTIETPIFTVIINYWYNEVGGATAAPMYIREALMGTNYNVASPNIPGYTPSMGRVIGTLTGNMVWDVVYTPNRYDLTINYIYEDGTTAAPTHNSRHYSGDQYNVPSPAIAGYTVSMATVSGTMAARDVTVTVIYTAQAEGIETYTIDEYGVPLGLGNVQINVGECFE